KPFALLASPFQHTLFLDPDSAAVRDPTFLFDSDVYAHAGALFWPDFPVRPDKVGRGVGQQGGGLWRMFDVPYRKEWEFESGQIVVDKERAWRGLWMAAHICKEANYFFQDFLGDKESFFWGFSATRTPYLLNPIYLHSLGAVTDPEHPGGDPELIPLLHASAISYKN
ncbi:hypothetical protein DFJ73DRAFT_603137, partial [Zopfochytrium polystomum]